MLGAKNLPDFIIRLMLVVGLVPVAFAMIVASGGLGIFVLIIVAAIFFPKLILWDLPKAIVKGLVWVFLPKVTPTRFMGPLERSKLLNAGNKGLLVDGQSARLSDSVSYESVLVQGGMGRSKTSTFVIPNL